jgi:hypothetical protein
VEEEELQVQLMLLQQLVEVSTARIWWTDSGPGSIQEQQELQYWWWWRWEVEQMQMVVLLAVQV